MYDASRPAGAFFDERAARRGVRWIERNLRHYKGRWAGMPFYLLGWERRLIENLFGWKRPDGTRLYRRCYVEAPRKSGKTMLAAAVGLYLAYGDGEVGPEGRVRRLRPAAGQGLLLGGAAHDRGQR